MTSPRLVCRSPPGVMTSLQRRQGSALGWARSNLVHLIRIALSVVELSLLIGEKVGKVGRAVLTFIQEANDLQKYT